MFLSVGYVHMCVRVNVWNATKPLRDWIVCAPNMVECETNQDKFGPRKCQYESGREEGSGLSIRIMSHLRDLLALFSAKEEYLTPHRKAKRDQ